MHLWASMCRPNALYYWPKLRNLEQEPEPPGRCYPVVEPCTVWVHCRTTYCLYSSVLGLARWLQPSRTWPSGSDIRNPSVCSDPLQPISNLAREKETWTKTTWSLLRYLPYLTTYRGIKYYTTTKPFYLLIPFFATGFERLVFWVLYNIYVCDEAVSVYYWYQSMFFSNT